MGCVHHLKELCVKLRAILTYLNLNEIAALDETKLGKKGECPLQESSSFLHAV